MGCWELSRWLVFARALQLAASLAAAAMHGAVTVRVYVGPLGLSTHMVVLELLIFVVLGHSILALSFCRSKKRRIVLAGFALCDVFFCAVALILVVLLDHAGLPLNCGGMTTIRFSDESPGQRGELDVLCHFERFYYAITVALLFSYMFTANLTVLCIMKQRYARTAGVNEVDGVEGGINLKLLGTPSPHDEPPTPNLPPAHLPSEGIMTRGTSLRSAVTAATVPSSSRQAASPSALPSSNPTPSRRPADVHPPTIPRRPLAQASSSSSRTSAAAVFTSGPVDEAEQDAAAAAAHVADGLQYQPKAQQHGHDHHHHHDYRNPSREFPGMAVLSEEEQAAHQALVTDGMRPSSDSPPPRYEPRKT